MEAYGLDDGKYTMTTSYFLARLLQHECDHLDGILYPMRMQNMNTFGFVSELGPATYPTFPSIPKTSSIRKSSRAFPDWSES